MLMSVLGAATAAAERCKSIEEELYESQVGQGDHVLFCVWKNFLVTEGITFDMQVGEVTVWQADFTKV